MRPLLNYLRASRAELAKVTWPNRRQTVRLTMAVVLFSLAMAIILGALDSAFTALVQKVIV